MRAPSEVERFVHKAETNWLPLSEVIVDGTPNLAVQLSRKASATVFAVMSRNGIASGQRENRSIAVRRYE